MAFSRVAACPIKQALSYGNFICPWLGLNEISSFVDFQPFKIEGIDYF